MQDEPPVSQIRLINLRNLRNWRLLLQTTANQLTILRIVFVPVFIILLSYGNVGLALATFVAAGLTDALDGVIARCFGQKTPIGALLDPLADKLLMVTAVVILSMPQMELVNTIPRWLMIIMISRDVFILLIVLIVVLLVGWRPFTPSRYGKASTLLQVMTILAVLYTDWRSIVMPELSILFYITGFMTAFSGLHYLATGRQYLNES